MASFQLRDSYPHRPAILGDDHYAEVLAFLSADVVLNLFQLCWLDNHGVTGRARQDLFHFSGLRGPAGRFQAVALVISGRLLLVHALRPSAASTMGRWYRDRGVVLEHIVSGRSSVEPFWEAYRQVEASPTVSARLDRHQTLYALDRGRWLADVRPRLRAGFAPTGVRHARLEELDSVYLASAQMHLEETLENPLDAQPEAFRKHVRHRIQTNRTFVWFDDHRRLEFKADLSAYSSFGTQISGVYTPPRFRGQGVATRALFDICEELFESGLPRITLYVNAGNKAAHRVYRKVGFQSHADYQTVFVESSNE
jgi:RimJ/RimL family protein N-acetyltransferase